ncbi:MAG: polymorphic toxin-type HINT domain-containing protein, partial [Phycisphaerae bacterium]
DGARQRYLNRELDPETLEPVPGGDTWSDYDGDEIYGDYMIDGQTVTNLRSFEPGIAKVAWNGGQPDPTTLEHYHTDMIGTTRLMTDSSGAGILPATYTAFGERIAGTNHRYGYAGAYGYQTHDDFPFLHVGARYYDPSTGRFLQRDPIGIHGGLNVYGYVNLRPTVELDASGLKPRRGAGATLQDSGGGHGPEAFALACQILWACGSCACMGESGYPPGCEQKNEEERRKRREELRRRHKLPPPPPPRILTDPVSTFWNWLTGGLTGGSCFVAGTPVETSVGPIAIEDVVVQACVLSQDIAGARDVYATVTKTVEACGRTLVNVRLPEETITCTPEHPFWVIGEGWVNAGALHEGCQLLSADGKGVSVLGAVRECPSRPVRVYNMTVDGEHTYYVGESRVLVHNKW